MEEFFQGKEFLAAALALMTVVFLVALVSLRRELGYIRGLADYLGYDLVLRAGSDATAPAATLATDEIRDQVAAVLTTRDPASAHRQVRGWMMRAHRLEPALAFWIDFLRQLGLLFTVLGLGLSLAVGDGSANELLEPLALAVWTTVAGLIYSLWLSARFGLAVTVWADTCEKNIEAWSSRRSDASQDVVS